MYAFWMNIYCNNNNTLNTNPIELTITLWVIYNIHYDWIEIMTSNSTNFKLFSPQRKKEVPTNHFAFKILNKIITDNLIKWFYFDHSFYIYKNFFCDFECLWILPKTNLKDLLQISDEKEVIESSFPSQKETPDTVQKCVLTFGLWRVGPMRLSSFQECFTVRQPWLLAGGPLFVHAFTKFKNSNYQLWLLLLSLKKSTQLKVFLSQSQEWRR